MRIRPFPERNPNPRRSFIELMFFVLAFAAGCLWLLYSTIWIMSDRPAKTVPLPTFAAFVRRCLCPDCEEAHLDIDADGRIYCPWCRLLDQAIAAPDPEPAQTEDL